MSVQKFRLKKGQSNFTTIPNKVLQELNNYEALGLYSYICSLSDNWEFHKSQLCSHGNIGRDKLNKLLKILEDCALIEIAQIRGEKGQFAHFDMIVNDGTSFKINKITENSPPFTEKPLTANPSLVNRTYKRNSKKTNINNKRNISCASSDARDRFVDFKKIYPKDVDMARAEKLWTKNKLNKIADEIIDKIGKQIESDAQWKDIKFIPSPYTYLINQRWKDDVIIYAHEVKPKKAKFIDDYKPSARGELPANSPLRAMGVS